KVADSDGQWTWRRLSDLRSGDRVPMMLGGMVGEPTEVQLPPLPDAYWKSDRYTFGPRRMTADLAELIGYFMGDGSLHTKGIRVCVTSGDRDVVDHLTGLGESLFGLKAAVTQKRGYTEVAFNSVRLVLWWEACGFAKRVPVADHRGRDTSPTSPKPSSTRTIQPSTALLCADSSKPTERSRPVMSRSQPRPSSSAATCRRSFWRSVLSARARWTRLVREAGAAPRVTSCAC